MQIYVNVQIALKNLTETLKITEKSDTLFLSFFLRM